MASAYARLGIGGVDDADRRHVHRRAAVDDVADASLTGIDVAVVQAGHEPLLGEEDAVEEQRLVLQFRDPPPLADEQRHEMLGNRVGVEVIADSGVDVDEGERHQRVVGDVAVALVVRGDRPGVAPVLVEGRDDPGDVAAVARLDVRRWSCPQRRRRGRRRRPRRSGRRSLVDGTVPCRLPDGRRRSRRRPLPGESVNRRRPAPSRRSAGLAGLRGRSDRTGTAGTPGWRSAPATADSR